MKKGLTANALKLIAIIAMLFDHMLWVIRPGYDNGPVILLLHAIGRVTAPIMCYFIAEGYHRTSNRKRYALRLLLFAVVSHFAYAFAFGLPFTPLQTGILNQTSVMWSLFWGLVALWMMDSDTYIKKDWIKLVLLLLICAISFPSDWSCIAVLMIVFIGSYRNDLKKQMGYMLLFAALYALVYCLFIDIQYGLLQLAVVFAIPLLKQYNGQRGTWRGMKWVFYVFYPLHLILCGIVRILLHGNIAAMIGG